MKRFAFEHLYDWLNSNGRKPLVLRGARQVGKSTLIKLFAENFKLDLIEVNCEKTKLKSVRDDNFKLENLVEEIEFISNKKIKKNTILFLDEIQADPLAIQYLRYFYEERPEIAVVCAGSLLELTLAQNEISFPVGRVSFYYLGPMTFCEYLCAIDKEELANKILKEEIQEFHHQTLLDEFKKFMFIGGMPKAIFTYSQTKNLRDVSDVHRDLVQAYINDFPKYGKRLNLEKLQSIFEKFAFHLGKKLIYQHIDREIKSIDVKKQIELLRLANIITPAYHTDASGIPLGASVDHSVMKAYFLDVGLSCYFNKIEWTQFENIFSADFLSKGFMAEQFIAQHLAYSTTGKEPPSLMFWLRDKSAQKAEVDFILQKNTQIIPIEVKSQAGGKLRSLKVFAEEKNVDIAYKFSQEWYSSEKIKLQSGKELLIKTQPLYSIEGFCKKNVVL